MVDAGESEADIAAVIQRLSSKPTQPEPEKAWYNRRIDDLPEVQDLRAKGWGGMIDSAASGGMVSAAPTAINQAVQQFAPGVSKALKGGAERLYGGLLKAKDSTIERFPTVVQDLLKARAPISQGGRSKVITGLKKIGAEKNTLLQGADERAMVPREALRGGLDDSLDAAIANSETPVKDMGKLAKMEKELIPDEPGILPSRADRIKTKLQTEAQRGYLGNKTGAKVTDTAANAKMNVAGRAKGALEAIEPKLGPVNAAYASGKGQSIALKDALKRTDKHSPIGISDLFGGVLGTAAGGPAGGAAGLAAMKAIHHPNVGSRAAIYMNDASRIPHLDQAMKAALLALLAEQE
jgi:hypothetical protein